MNNKKLCNLLIDKLFYIYMRYLRKLRLNVSVNQKNGDLHRIDQSFPNTKSKTDIKFKIGFNVTSWNGWIRTRTQFGKNGKIPLNV